MSQVVFTTNLEAKLLGECVPKPELGNEEQRLPACLHSNRNFIPLKCYEILLFPNWSLETRENSSHELSFWFLVLRI